MYSHNARDRIGQTNNNTIQSVRECEFIVLLLGQKQAF